MTRISGDNGDISARRFLYGIRFKTLCGDCNSRLGGREDKALADFYGHVRKIVESRFILSPLMRVSAKPNLIIRGLLAHMASVNDGGWPSPFDDEARAIFFNKRNLRSSSWNLFYWVYVGQELFLARSLFYTTWSPQVELREMFIVKMYPLAFLFIKAPIFLGLPNMMQFIQPRDEEETEVPIFVYLREGHPVWPAYTSNTNSIMLGGNAYGLVAHQN